MEIPSQESNRSAEIQREDIGREASIYTRLTEPAEPAAQRDTQNARSLVQQSVASPPQHKALPAVQGREEQDLPRREEPMKTLKEKWMERMESLTASLVKDQSSRSEKKAFALDCEMVAIRIPGSSKNVHKAAYVGVVDTNGRQIYCSYISQKYTIANCFTKLTGIRRWDLKRAPSLQKVQEDLSRILKGNILVGHALKNDLKSLEMQHPICDQRDTQKFFERNLPYGERRTNLKLMASVHLGQAIQRSCHNPVEDALATMDLYLLYRDHVDAQAGCSADAQGVYNDDEDAYWCGDYD